MRQLASKIALGRNFLPVRSCGLVFEPADQTHLPSGFAARAAIGEEIVGGATGARSDLKKLIARHAGVTKNITVQAAKIDERFAVLDQNARRR